MLMPNGLTRAGLSPAQDGQTSSPASCRRSSQGTSPHCQAQQGTGGSCVAGGTGSSWWPLRTSAWGSQPRAVFPCCTQNSRAVASHLVPSKDRAARCQSLPTHTKIAALPRRGLLACSTLSQHIGLLPTREPLGSAQPQACPAVGARLHRSLAQWCLNYHTPHSHGLLQSAGGMHRVNKPLLQAAAGKGEREHGLIGRMERRGDVAEGLLALLLSHFHPRS